jgi:carboxyl-terminal processing protease
MFGPLLAEAGAPPLEAGDVILSVDSVALAGMSAEEIAQISEISGDNPHRVTVLRKEQNQLVEEDLSVVAQRPEEPEESHLATTMIAFGGAQVLEVAIHDVPDNLGDELARVLFSEEKPTYAGVVIDLRNNGGGSIDGATSALGLFMPGVPLFPMKHRSGTIEIEHAATPASHWDGPLAVLVNGSTASAAEMISGAISAYKRGPVLGTPTFGKGCAQEYFDAPLFNGVLRLTTLVFALPDGRALQKKGITPDFSLPIHEDDSEREADHFLAPTSWTGPDVRDPKTLPPHAWTRADNWGPCEDETVCLALEVLANSSHSKARLGDQNVKTNGSR